MMEIRNLLYLLQLEMYDVNRFEAWLKKNPGRVVLEKKKRLVRTKKVKLLYGIANIAAPVLGNERAVVFAVRFIFPLDWILKKIFLTGTLFKLRLFHRNTLVIGICGSWGKTTVKEILSEVLKTKYRVHCTKSNDNTLLGIAIHARSMPRDTEIFIAEMDAWRRGELREVCRLIRPTIGITTAIGPMHLERFKSIQDLYAANLELYESLPKNGFALLPEELHESIRERKDAKTVFFKGIDEILYAVGKSFGIDEKVIKEKIKTTIVPHRTEVTRNHGITIIDNAYNSNPASFRRSLEKLDGLEARRKIFVTPGMIEMGDRQFIENKKAAEEAARVCTHIIIVGETNRAALIDGAKSAKKSVKGIEAPTFEDAKNALSKITEKGSAVLFENDLGDQYF